MTADLLEAPPEAPGFSAFAEPGAKVPWGGAKLGGEFDLICGKGKGKLTANIGPLGGDTKLDSNLDQAFGAGPMGSVNLSPDDMKPEGIETGHKVEGKAGFKGCTGVPPG